MTGCQAFPQPICESIKLHPPIERAEGRRPDVRAVAASADRMACRTHSLCKRLTVLLQGAGLAVLSEAGRRCEQQKDGGEPQDQLENSLFRRTVSNIGANDRSCACPATLQSGSLEQVSHAPARIEHAGLHCIFRRSDDSSNVLERLFVIIDKVEHFPV